jgi:nitrogen fixation NifU-like protein
MDQEEQQMYMEQLMDNYKNPQNIGKIEDYTLFHHYKNPSCGDTFDMYVKLDENNKKIIDVKYTGDGCAISTASISLLSQELIGMDFEKSKKLTDNFIYDILGVRISPGRTNCAMLSINAFKNSIKEFEKNN